MIVILCFDIKLDGSLLRGTERSVLSVCSRCTLPAPRRARFSNCHGSQGAFLWPFCSHMWAITSSNDISSKTPSWIHSSTSCSHTALAKIQHPLMLDKRFVAPFGAFGLVCMSGTNNIPSYRADVSLRCWQDNPLSPRKPAKSHGNKPNK